MKHAVRALVTIAFGVGLAAAAQAAPGYSGTPAAGMPNVAPNATMQDTAPGANPQAEAPTQMGEATTARHHLARSDIKQAQQELKSQGLYRGRIDGIVGHQTRAAIAAFQQHNGLHRTARLDEDTLTRLTSGETPAAGSGVGSGSSNPPTTVLKGTPAEPDTAPMTPPAIPAPKEK